MLFTQIEFIILWITILCLLFLVRKPVLTKTILLLSSYYFYAYWDYRFLVLIIIPTVIDFFIGILLGADNSSIKRKLLLLTSLVVNLGILGYFKYFKFFLSSLQSVSLFQNVNLETLYIILPIGISFYTFRTLSYTIDVYLRKIEPSRNILDYAVFVSFFPVLLAGPIARASSLLPQIRDNVALLTKDKLYAGFRLFVIGIFLKIFVADKLSIFVNSFFDQYNAFDSTTTLLAVLAYALQIYCDFAGYSSMAIGISLTMGFHIENNFDFPYLATNISDFWRRWHITLSNWIRDYIYIPLGGSRTGKWRTHLNLLIAMTLCGLWHGAAWTFVFWGFYHGILMSIRRIWSQIFPNNNQRQSKVINFCNWFLTFLMVAIGWIFFRSTRISQSISIIGKLVDFKTGVVLYQPLIIFIITAAVLHHCLKINGFKICELPLKAWYTPPILIGMICLVIIFYPNEVPPFIYSQF